MGSTEEPARTVHSIAVIGAGPSGLAAAKYLVAEGFEKIVIFEQRENVGGLWNYSAYDRDRSKPIKVPQTDPHVGNEEPNQDTGDGFMSPIYDRLETNIPRGLMGFSDLDWPENSQLFPQHQVVLKYIEDYSLELQRYIKYSTQVVDVRHAGPGEWQVATRDVQSSEHTMHKFDAVVVANGHFNIPWIPAVEGMEAWQQAYPGSIIHSQTFRRPEDFAGRKVIVVGNSASGIDIGAQIRQQCSKPMIQSSLSKSYLSPDPSADQVERPMIIRYDTVDRTIHFADATQESGIDAVVYCTGYMYSYPFLETLKPSLISTGERVQGLYKHLFWQQDTTLSFLVLIQKAIPFPVAEVQGAVVARVLSGRLTLPSIDVMMEWEQVTLNEAPRTRDFHLLKFPKDYHYINELHDWAVSVDTLKGKRPPRWNTESYWTRENFPEIKKAFGRLGDARHTVRTLGELGFEFPGESCHNVMNT